MMKIAVCIPLKSEWTTAEWALSLRRLILPPGSHFFFNRSHAPIDRVRTQLVKEALKTDVTHIFFLDSDVIVAPDTVEQLLSYKWPITSGLYPDKGGRPAAWKNRTPIWFETGAMIVDEVGFGYVLIDRRVFEKIPCPWFSYEFDLENEEKPSEDIFLCRRAKEYGFPVLLTGIKAGHVFTGKMVTPTTITHLEI